MDFGGIGKAAETAFGRIDTAMGNDPELDLYDKLTPDAFKKLSDIYGKDQIDDYIKTMEGKRRMKNGQR